VDGLQVESKPGHWLDVDSAVDAVVLNTGDLMAHWSNDRFPSTRHRVCRRSSKARLSIAFFCDPDAETLVEVQPGFMADGDVVRYAKTTAGEHIQAKLLASHHAAQAADRKD
jgi:isopenicillin N synthase-like dioxygenase